MIKLNPPYLGVAYYPEDWPDTEIDKDISKMLEVGINVARIAEFAWHRMEQYEGKFDFSFFHKVVDKLGAAGIGVVLGTPTATPPIWLGRRYPDVFMENEDGTRQSFGGRRHCCSNNPHYNEYSLRIVEEMSKEFANDPSVIGWQIDNEIYSGGKGCFCNDCQQGFKRWLREKYSTIDNLNEAWNLNLFSQWYDTFDDIPAPRNAWHNPHLVMEWLTFQNKSHSEFVGRQADIMHKYIKNVPIGTDIMPVNGMDYREMFKKLDIVQFNHYNEPKNLWSVNMWFDYLRGIKDRPFWNTETATCWNGSVDITQSIKPEGYNRANSWLPVALGAEANMYWLWRTHWAGHELTHGAVLNSDGSEMHTTGEVTEVSQGFKKAADFINGTKVDTNIAIHFTSHNWNMIMSQPQVRGLNYCSALSQYIYKPITDLGLRPDVIDAYEPLDKYSVVFSPLMMTIEEGNLPQRIKSFVENGGTWIAGPLTDVRNYVGAKWIDKGYGSITDITGTKLKYTAPDLEGNIKAKWADGTDFTGNTWYEMVEDEDALVKVTECHSAMVGKGIVTVKNVGKGKVVLLGTLPSYSDMQKLIKLIINDIPNVTGEVTVSPRKGENGLGVILVEHGAGNATYTLKKHACDILTGKTYDGTISLKPYEVMVLKYL